MTLRHPFLFVAFGATLLSGPVLAQSTDATGYGQSATQGGYGTTPPGYNDPYARGSSASGDGVERTELAPPSGYQQAPSYGTGAAASQQQGYSQGSYSQGSYPQAVTPEQGGAQPGPVTPQASVPQQGGYPQANYPRPSAEQQQAYGQPGYGQQQQPGYGAQPASYGQQPAQAGYGNQAPYGQPAYDQGGQGGYNSGNVTPPAGVYGPNAAVVPGTQEAPSGPRIENVDPSEPVPDRFRRQLVDYVTTQPAGTIVIDTPNTYLYYVLGNNKAMRYGIGVGREGFTWSGTEKISRKAEWPDWRPPTEMIDRQPYLPRFMAGGPGNPMGARALYLGGTIYRIHGTNEPQTIGKFVSSGCIRMLNNDVEDLFDRVKVGTKVVIMPKPPSAQVSAVPSAPGTTGSIAAAQH